ncbi:MAG: hypothetical protein WDN29_08110 [Methylovirgula sp.]
MTAKKLQPKGFDEIIDNLREHKEKIDRAIMALEALREERTPSYGRFGKTALYLTRQERQLFGDAFP